MQFLRAKQQKQRDERRKRFMPNIADDSKKEKKDSDGQWRSGGFTFMFDYFVLMTWHETLPFVCTAKSYI